MELQINKEYNYVTYLNSFSLPIGEPRRIVSSPKVNHELLAMMFARNYSENVIIANQMSELNLTDEEASILAAIGCFQFDQSNEAKLKYEFLTLLKSINLVVLNIPKEAVFIKLQEDLLKSGDIIDLTALTTSNKLMMLAYSPSPIKDLSSEIHNEMVSPHYLMNKFVLFHTEKDYYELTSILDADLINKQNDIEMGDGLVEYENLNTTSHIEVGWDNSSGRYLLTINESSKLI